eukprot:11192773-Lingulodinium_polyedra.AAC.1
MVETMANKERSEYVPFSVWSTRGFDPDMIKKGGKYLWHSVLGDTYCSGIVSWSREKKQEMMQEDGEALGEG